ncbi:MAG: phosphate ABC transporter ATP-binding protein [Myxococcales bacterium]|nr:phosphate ABC transporter ATP-binding protein [Myxococcales bacterium]
MASADDTSSKASDRRHLAVVTPAPKELRDEPSEQPASGGEQQPKFSARELNAWFGAQHVLENITLDIASDEVTAIIGPSGCGKSTFIRCLNRMHELEPDARVSGEVLFDGETIYAPTVDPTLLRRRIGMVFQRANPFPAMSIRDNVLAGRRLTGRLRRGEADEIVETALREAALWSEVDYRLGHSSAGLSGGQQQRLCIARALAMQPEVLLMDEPCAALDPVATARLEDLIHSLKGNYTIVIVTHNMQQAARVSSQTAFFLDGALVEYQETDRLFTSPEDPRTEDYLTGKFG